MNRIATLLAAGALAFSPLATSAQSITPPTGGSSLTTPVSPANGGSGVANTGNLTWNAAQTLSFTSGQTMTFPAASTTLAGLGTAQTFSAANTFSVAGAASTPNLALTGATFVGGNATTNKPSFLIEPTGTTSTGWNAAGAMLGINGASGYAGFLINAQLNGAARFSVDSTGIVTGVGGLSTAATATAGTFAWSGRSTFLTSPSNAVAQLGQADAASPIAQSLYAQSVAAGASNIAGVTTTVRGSLSTGSGTSGDIIAQTGGTGAAATVQNTAATGWTLKGASQHFQFGGNIAPAITSCGTGSPSITGADNAGVVTIGTTATACTITFHTAFGATPVCVLNDQTALVNLTSYTVSTAALVLTMAANSGNLISYICNGA